MTFEEWKKENFKPSEELLNDLKGYYALDAKEELDRILLEQYEMYQKTVIMV